MQTNQDCAEVCNSLLRGELSAVETYRQALEKFDNETESHELRSLLGIHQKSVELLTDNVRKMGGKPATDSGAWGDFAKAVEGGAKILGDSAALSALKTGEEHGLNDYKRAIDNDDVMPECKAMITSTLIPRQNQNIARLEALQSK